MKEDIPYDNWFQIIFGVKESKTNVYNHITCEENEGNSIIVCKNSGNKYNAGQFMVRNISSFNLSPRGNGKLFIIAGNGRASKKFELIDVTINQSLPENDGATYLAASNYNCLEFVNNYQTASHGISGYVYDPTQGPFCAIAAPQSILYRNYFVNVNGKIGQIETEINLLENTPVEVDHGYAIITRSDEEKLKKSSFDWKDLNNYKVGVHRNCQLLLTKAKVPRFLSLIQDPNRIVHHVYSAAFNFNGSVHESPFTREIRDQIIEASYRCAILSAWENSIEYPNRAGSNKLYLTLLGCGVFGNSVEDVARIISKCTDLIIDSGLDVYVVCFTDNTTREAFPILNSSIVRTGGSIISTD